MMVLAAVVFGVSLAAICALFIVKHREAALETTFAPELKARADYQALRVKAFVRKALREAEKIPPTTVLLTRIAIREGALLGARIGQALETQSHKVADRVSHRHRFERRDTNSDFLKRMGEGRNGVSADENLESRE